MSIFTSQFDRARAYADDYAGHHADPGLADPVTRHGDAGLDAGSVDGAGWGDGWDHDWDLDPGHGSNAETATGTHHDASGAEETKLHDSDPHEADGADQTDEAHEAHEAKHIDDDGWKHPDDYGDAGSGADGASFGLDDGGIYLVDDDTVDDDSVDL
ncbi:hypothetical protein MXD62_05920 [Frankia sp. Mgl5]|uniref:hypothetical protein n=1 Tax=Frankia sp. Mgl5 TaxID=2933793 RepID=UPI0020103C1D|nr:hypothetical protein [Frankia sp. Mgl5]MCK9926708.1 hypothetical protein [Frankia sp. Mgl5]